MTATASPKFTAVDALTDRLGYSWPCRFTLRGREYTIRPGVRTYAEGYAIFPVWNAAGKATSVKVRETDRIALLSVADADGRNEVRFPAPLPV